MTPQPATLPVLIPSTAAVENAGRTFGMLVDPSLRWKWDEAPGHVRNHYNRTALDLLNAAAPHLIADVLEWAVTNHKALGMSAATVDELIDAALEARGAAEASHQGTRPGLL